MSYLVISRSISSTVAGGSAHDAGMKIEQSNKFRTVSTNVQIRYRPVDVHMIQDLAKRSIRKTSMNTKAFIADNRYERQRAKPSTAVSGPVSPWLVI
jgi:hypothetical protein